MQSAKGHVDEETGCLCRFVSSGTEYFKLHYHDYYEVFLTQDAEVIHLVNDTSQRLMPGSLVLIRPRDVHTYVYDMNQKYHFVNLTFTAETAEQLFSYLSDGFPSNRLLESPLPPMVVLEEKEKIRLLRRFEELNTIHWENKPELKLRMRVLLVEIFTRYFAQVADAEAEGSDIPYWLEALCEAMKKPVNFSAGLDRMVELCGKSREHLARSLRRYFDLSPTEFINRQRIRYIANMLLNSNHSILDLCYDSGFQNVGWFYSLFKQEYGMSPGEFRRRAKH